MEELADAERLSSMDYGFCGGERVENRSSSGTYPIPQFCRDFYHHCGNFLQVEGLIYSTLTQTLYNLAAYPEYVEPLRQEIEELVASQGWDKTTVTKLHKLDSFLKETMRLHPFGQSNFHCRVTLISN